MNQKLWIMVFFSRYVEDEFLLSDEEFYQVIACISLSLLLDRTSLNYVMQILRFLPKKTFSTTPLPYFLSELH